MQTSVNQVDSVSPVPVRVSIISVSTLPAGNDGSLLTVDLQLHGGLLYREVEQ